MRISLNLLAKFQAGGVKTRLRPLLGEAGAAWAHGRLLQYTLQLVQDWQQGDPNRLLRLWLTPTTGHPFFQIHAPGVAQRQQPEGDLGQRMRAATAAGLADGEAVVLVGGDAASLTRDLLEQLCLALTCHQAVMAPTEDGGYLALGLRQCDDDLFQDMPWGSSEVAALTRQRFHQRGWSWSELPLQWDVDRPAEWVRFATAQGLPVQPEPTAASVLVLPDSPFGPLWLVGDDQGVNRLSWHPIQGQHPPSPVLMHGQRWLARYFAGDITSPDFPLHPQGTTFQKKVWAWLPTIPPGHTMTYGNVARQVGSAARAIGQAMRTNPLPLVIPCHRVVAGQGLGGYSGWGGVAAKQWLLDWENKTGTEPWEGLSCSM